MLLNFSLKSSQFEIHIFFNDLKWRNYKKKQSYGSQRAVQLCIDNLFT